MPKDRKRYSRDKKDRYGDYKKWYKGGDKRTRRDDRKDDRRRKGGRRTKRKY